MQKMNSGTPVESPYSIGLAALLLILLVIAFVLLAGCGSSSSSSSDTGGETQLAFTPTPTPRPRPKSVEIGMEYRDWSSFCDPPGAGDDIRELKSARGNTTTIAMTYKRGRKPECVGTFTFHNEKLEMIQN